MSTDTRSPTGRLGKAQRLFYIGVTSAHLIGLSWGGILAQEFYRVSPQRVRSLVLADTYAGWKSSLSEQERRQRLETCLRDSTRPADALLAELMPGMFTDEAYEEVRDEMGAIMSEFHPTSFRVMSRSAAEMDIREILPRIGVPTLVL